MGFQSKLIVVFVLCFVFITRAQDIHFSQYNGSLSNLNPAFTGLFDGDYRVNGIYRSQWQAVPVPYRTISMAGDMRYKPKQIGSDCIGIGIHFNNDQAGDAFYTGNQFYLSGSYIHKLKRDSSLLISLGFDAGIINSNFNYNQMTFDNQFDGFAYNGALGTGESFQKTKTTVGDFNFGTAIQYSFSQFTKLTYAFAFNHLSNPVISYQGNPRSKIDTKLTNYLAFETPITDNNKFIWVSELLYGHQGKYNEFVPGTGLKYSLDNTINNSISLGLYFRTRDAFISRLGYSYKTTTAGISYDVNTSKFLAATNRRGAFEIYITHIIKRYRPYIAKKRVCPVFM